MAFAWCNQTRVARAVALAMVAMVCFGLAKADIAQDREKCTNQLVGLAPCLPYVGGEAKAPTKDCCTGLKQVLAKSKLCLCILIKDRDDPSLGLKINATLALGLPDSCQAPANIHECLSLLHLQPGSPDAKVFEDYAKGTKNSNSTKSSNSTIAPPGDAPKGPSGSSNEGGINKLLGLDILMLLFVVVICNNII